MGFLQGPITTIHRHDGVASGLDDRTFAAVIPVAARDTSSDTVLATIEAVAAVEPAMIAVPVRGQRTAVETLTDSIESVTDRASVIWCDGPAMTSLCADRGVPLVGKGSDVWLALGPAAEAAEVVCCLDADASTVKPDTIRRLVVPLDGNLLATKAFYTRIEDRRLFGRLARLLVRPLILTLADRYHHPFIDYLRAFDYPLAGEIALDRSLVEGLRVPAGMGLEIGTLGEFYRLAGPDTIAQVDLGNHRHDHRPVDGSNGLVSIAPEVVGALRAVLEPYDGLSLDATIIDAYVRWAERLIDRYERDATFNGLRYDRVAERAQVEEYRSSIEAPREPRWMPAWSTVDLDPAQVLEVGCPPGVTT